MRQDNSRQALAVRTGRQGQIGGDLRAIGRGIGHGLHLAERDICKVRAHIDQRLERARLLVEQVNHARLGVARGDQQQAVLIRARADDVDHRLAGQRLAEIGGDLGERRVEIGDGTLFGRIARPHRAALAADAQQGVDIDIAARQQDLARPAPVEREFGDRPVAVLVDEAVSHIADAIDRNGRKTARRLAVNRQILEGLPAVAVRRAVEVELLAGENAVAVEQRALLDPHPPGRVGDIARGHLVGGLEDIALAGRCIDKVDPQPLGRAGEAAAGGVFGHVAARQQHLAGLACDIERDHVPAELQRLERERRLANRQHLGVRPVILDREHAVIGHQNAVIIAGNAEHLAHDPRLGRPFALVEVGLDLVVDRDDTRLGIAGKVDDGEHLGRARASGDIDDLVARGRQADVTHGLAAAKDLRGLGKIIGRLGSFLCPESGARRGEHTGCSCAQQRGDCGECHVQLQTLTWPRIAASG